VLLFQKLPDAWKVEDSLFLGEGLYGAPVVRRGVTTRHVWLPPGRYVERGSPANWLPRAPLRCAT